MSSYTTISNFAQRRMAPIKSETDHLVRKSFKSDGQGTMLFFAGARRWSHSSAWQKDVDWYCCCFGVLRLQLSHSREHQHRPESLSICFSWVSQGGSMCSITLCVCVCIYLSVYLHSAVLLPHQQLLNLLTNFKEIWQTIRGLQSIEFQDVLWKLAAGGRRKTQLVSPWS